MADRISNPLGPIVNDKPARRPTRDTKLVGRYITVVGLSAEHADSLFPHISGPENAHLWDYVNDGPYDDITIFRGNLKAREASQDPVFFALLLNDQNAGATNSIESKKVVGMASFLRIDPKSRSIEVGVMYSPQLQRTPAATEAMYLMTRHAFEDLSYRRCEWKCNSLNAAGRRAAERLGFMLEGIFRKHMIIRGRNRDTAWYSMVDDEWPGAKRALEAWLDAANFDGEGRQKKKLEDFRQ
ncbi:putative acetyltransferase, GNAT family [Hypoxylon rubiginosum]|uniref:Acetyltransferase, GNAT family n=1 Tax=Hypoxylon rubiginosum TaxID=110542 RepID=A0ACC0DBE4_9PEZI|nr:putative acetyltransferase, GNAT family [Hypoxylon rubiginosum]